MRYILLQSMKNSTSALWRNRGRSFLTMLGIIIGVGAVILIMAVGAGAQSLILSQFTSLGSDLVGVMPGKAEEGGPPASLYGIVITTLTYEDVEAMGNKNNVPDIVAAVGSSRGVVSASWENNQYDTNLNGTTANYMEVEGGEVEEGRFFTKEEEKSLAKVAVLGSKVADELFGDSFAVGQKIRLNKQNYEVIGVMKKRGMVAFQDYDDQIFIPVLTAQKMILGVDHLGLIRAKINNGDNYARAVADIEALLRLRHGIEDQSGKSDDFEVRSMNQAMDTITTTTNALKYFLAAMAALSLIVGGIGIMNIMLVSVTERTREIGLRKAVGANNMNILGQFLIESITVTSIGGIIGIFGGIALSYLVYLIANSLGYDWKFEVSNLSVILAVGVSSLIGIVFGLYPAWKASRLDPIEALRYE